MSTHSGSSSQSTPPVAQATKPCRACKTAIDINATKCPQCQADQRNWFLRHKVLSVIFALFALGILGGAAGQNSVNTKPATTSSSGSSTATKAAPQAHVGATVNIGGSQGVTVTLSHVIDPAQGDNQYTTPDAGKRFVGAEITVKNQGKGAYSDDANNDLTLIGSNGQSYTADFNTIAECTNFSSGSFNLAAGESATGCVTYQLPNGVQPAKVQYTSESGFSGQTDEWLIP